MTINGMNQWNGHTWDCKISISLDLHFILFINLRLSQTEQQLIFTTTGNFTTSTQEKQDPVGTYLYYTVSP